MTEASNKEWLNIKKQFKIGLIFSIIIAFLALLIFPASQEKNLEKKFINEIKILSQNPFFAEYYHGKSGTEYLIELKFVNDDRNYEIGGIDYYFLQATDFKNEVKVGDTILISRYENAIHYLSKNGKQYLDFKRAESNRLNSTKFLGLLFIPMIFICLVVLLFKQPPTIKLRHKIYKIQLDIIVILVFIISFIILALNIPFIIIESGKFVN
jgi:hypothetical protein